MAQQSYLIKILSGSNAGGEIEIFSTSVLVGDTDECDIILGDPFLEKRFFKMEIFEDSVSIYREDLPFYIDGRIVSEEEFTTRFYSVITVGSTSFVVGETNVLWPDITLPEIFLEKEQEDTEEHKEEETLEEALEEIDEEQEQEENNLEENSLENLLEEENEEETNPPKPNKMLRWIALVTLVGIVLFGVWYIFIKSPAFGSKEYLQNINSLLRENGFQQLRVGVRKPDLLIITGFVDKKEDIQTVENLVYNKAPKVLLFIKDLAQVLQEIQEYLVKNQVFIIVKYLASSANLNIAGYMKDENVLKRVQKDLQDLLPAFKSIRWKIRFWKEIKPVLDDEFSSVLLTEILIAKPYDFTIQVKGELTDKEQKQWLTIKASLMSTFSLINEVFIEKIQRIRARDPNKKKTEEQAENINNAERNTAKLDEGLMTILGIRRESKEHKLSDLPTDTNFDEVMRKDPCKYISIVPGEILFVKINGEQGLYSAGSMLPGELKIRDILQRTIILENKEDTFIFCTKD